MPKDQTEIEHKAELTTILFMIEDLKYLLQDYDPLCLYFIEMCKATLMAKKESNNKKH